MVPQMMQIINALHQKGRFPILVYNSNGYDKVEVLKALEGIIDVYLPDFKYSDAYLAHELSETGNYVDFARLALREMYRQKGSPLHLDDSGQAISGLIVRHLVLPGYLENSKKVLEFIAHELSPKIHISLMSQFHPMPEVKLHPNLGRLLSAGEYSEILDEMDRLGLENGWVQELDSSAHYLPDFNHLHPFEKEHNPILIPV
jgi:putative pyruvate formate lyase activating enzyme